MMNILVTGGSGLVGKGIESIAHLYPEYKFIFVRSSDYDLTDYEQTTRMFQETNPTYVIHLAACVGGLYKNIYNKVKMLEENLMINYNVVKCAHNHKVRKLIACLSTCIFPDKTTYPINEKMLHDGPPHYSNDSYAYAKRMLQIHCKAYRENYGDNFICIIPTNIYGPHDNYDLEDSHVIPGLIHKCYLAKQRGEPFVVRGTGTPLRQFIHSVDLAKLIMKTVKIGNEENIILSVGEAAEVTIKDVATMIARCFYYEDKLKFDATYTDGQYKKTADNLKMRQLFGDVEFISINDGIKESVQWFLDNYGVARGTSK